MSREPSPPATKASPSLRISTLVITNVTKMLGLYIGVHEALGSEDPKAKVLAFAGFMMAGAQISEEFALAFIDSFLGTRKGASHDREDAR